MPLEIERKFLAHPSVLEQCRCGVPIVQGYLHTDAENTVRVRRIGERYCVAWKGLRRGACREEVELPVLPEVGAALLATIAPATASRRPVIASPRTAMSGRWMSSPVPCAA